MAAASQIELETNRCPNDRQDVDPSSGFGPSSPIPTRQFMTTPILFVIDHLIGMTHWNVHV